MLKKKDFKKICKLYPKFRLSIAMMALIRKKMNDPTINFARPSTQTLEEAKTSHQPTSPPVVNIQPSSLAQTMNHAKLQPCQKKQVSPLP